MIKIENADVYGWEAAIRGARNPMNSWANSDSYYTYVEDPETLETARYEYFVGDNDLRLLRNLANAGPDHGKFLRFVTVTVDVTAPLYWWKEADTYKVGTVANSCSTMHKIHAKPFTLEDFSCEHLINDTNYFMALQCLNHTIDVLNAARDHYLQTKDKRFWWQMIQLLPSSYNQKRTLLVNYAVLRAMYHARKHHKLDCWVDFCRWIETLPYAKGLICDVDRNIR